MSLRPSAKDVVLALYDALLWMGLVADLLCVGALWARRAYRIFPTLALFMLYSTFGDTIGVWIYFSHLTLYWRYFLAYSALEYCLEFAVVFEMGRLVLPLTHGATVWRRVTALLAFGACAGPVLYFVTDVVHYYHSPASASIFAHAELTVGFLRALGFVVVFIMAMRKGVDPPRWISQLTIYFSLYFFAALISEYLHECFAMGKGQFDYFERIEMIRMGAWITTMILAAHSIRTGPIGVVDGRKEPAKGQPA